MELRDYLDEHLVHVRVDVKSDEETIRYLGAQLVAGGYVEPGYVEAVWERERISPTGIENNGCNFAITHAEGGRVSRAGIAIAVLREPVAFHRIDNPEQTTKVRVALMLAITDPAQQIKVLRLLMKKMQSPAVFEQLYGCCSGKNAICAICGDE